MNTNTNIYEVVLEVVVSDYLDVVINKDDGHYLMTWSDYNGINDGDNSYIELDSDELCSILDVFNELVPFNIKHLELKDTSDIITIKYNYNGNINYYQYDNVIPSNDYIFKELINLIFNYLPHQLYEYKYIADSSDEIEDYYKEINNFNLLADNIDLLFNSFVIGKGNNEYNHLKNIEYIRDKYYILIDNHLVIIKNTSDQVLVHCDCRYKYLCKHVYIALKAIQNNEYIPFSHDDIDKFTINSNGELDSIR